MKARNVVKIGNRFYQQSGTVMSSIYLDLGNGEYKRYDYGHMSIDKGNGYIINMREATPEELDYFEKKLAWLLLQR